jgi:hypothetical protein
MGHPLRGGGCPVVDAAATRQPRQIGYTRRPASGHIDGAAVWLARRLAKPLIRKCVQSDKSRGRLPAQSSRKTAFQSLPADLASTWWLSAPTSRWDAALETWPDGAKHMDAASPAYWFGVVQRDETPSFTTDVRSLVESFRPDLLLAEFATVATMTTVKELCHVPLVMTAWASEPGSGGFFDEAKHGAVDEFRATHGLPPVLGRFQVDHWVVFTPPSWGRIQGEPLASTLRTHVPAVRSTGWSAPASAGPFVYGTLGTVYNSRRRLGTLVDAIGLGGWRGLVTVGRTMYPSKFNGWPSVAIEQFVPQAACWNGLLLDRRCCATQSQACWRRRRIDRLARHSETRRWPCRPSRTSSFGWWRLFAGSPAGDPALSQ